MPWTAKWIAAIIGTFVLLVVADRLWYVKEMKALASALGVEWSKIERRGTFPYEHYKKVVHYGMTKDEVHKIMAHYSSVEEKQYGRYLYETFYYRFGALSRHGVRVEFDQFGRVRKVDDAPPVPPQDFSSDTGK
jgi:outer membrane protein assembly factor BamE (lipoprotein component of BamABCDE complex)